MQHTSRKGPRAACSQPSWFERDDLHLRDERVERPSFVGVGQKSSCIVSYTAAAAPRRRAFFMGRVLRDFAVVKKRLCAVAALVAAAVAMATAVAVLLVEAAVLGKV